MSFPIPSKHYTYCFTTAIKGEVISCRENLLQIRTDVGELNVNLNSATRVLRLEKVNKTNYTFKEINKNNYYETLYGNAVFGHVIVYKYPSKEETSLLCTELYVYSSEINDSHYMSPEFWVNNLINMADFWAKNAIDKELGGYFANIQEQGQVSTLPDGEDKWSYMVSRTLYAFSTAFLLTGNLKYLNHASIGKEYLIKYASFTKNGYTLFRTRLNRQNQKHPNDQEYINIFSQFYSLTGLIAFFEITRDPEIEEFIKSILKSLADLFYDKIHGGFFDAISEHDLKPVSGITDSKSFNSVIDPLSAILFFLDNVNFKNEYLNIKEIIIELCQIILSHFIIKDENFIREIFRRNWQFLTPNWYNPYNTNFLAGNIGGNNKIIWSILRAWDILPQATKNVAKEKLNNIHEKVITSGAWDSLRGGWFDVMDRNSPAETVAQHMWHCNKVWWQQESGVLGYLLFYFYTKNDSFLKIAKEGLQFFVINFIDYVYGGVYDTVSVDGLPINRWKGSWVKCAYHETELAKFAYIYLSVLLNKPIKLYYHINNTINANEYIATPTTIPELSWIVDEKNFLTKDILTIQYSSIFSKDKNK